MRLVSVSEVVRCRRVGLVNVSEVVRCRRVGLVSVSEVVRCRLEEGEAPPLKG